MKRAEALRPLSREHLTALLTAKRLREAEDPGQAAADFLEFWGKDGRQHFRVEEEVLLPVWALYAEVDREGVSRMLEEHLRIRRGALRLASGGASLAEVQELGKLLHDHVRFEERQLFPLVEAALDPPALDELAAAIERAANA